LLDAFSYHPPYYHFETDRTNYFDLGPQNSRGFRALKIWMAFQQAGRSGFVQAIADDIALAAHAFEQFRDHAEFQAVTHNLSICTFRYVPLDLRPSLGRADVDETLNRLNQELLTRLESGGEVFLSNAVLGGRFLLRICIVNFRTALEDIERLPALIASAGAQIWQSMKP
jgi:glutamate/tyrosine decarboxylase-like PLP-dependent enzyme